MDMKRLRQIGVIANDDEYEDFGHAYCDAPNNNGTEFCTGGIDFDMCEEYFNSRIDVIEAQKVGRMPKTRIKKTDDFDKNTKYLDDLPRMQIFSH